MISPTTERIRKQRKCLNGMQKRAIYLWLSQRNEGQLNLSYCLLFQAVKEFQIRRRVVQLIWSTGRKYRQIPGAVLQNISPQKKKKKMWKKTQRNSTE